MWHGRISPLVTSKGQHHRARVYIAKRRPGASDHAVPSHSYEQLGATEFEIGIGDLFHFPIGKIFVDGDDFSGPAEAKYWRHIQEEEISAPVLAGNKALDEDVSRTHWAPWWTALARDARCSIITDPATGAEFYLPHTEAVRYLYGASSDFTKGTVNGDLGRHSRPTRRVFWYERSGWNPRNPEEAFVFAHRRLRREEALIAARLVQNEASWSECKKISARLATMFAGRLDTSAFLWINLASIMPMKMKFLYRQAEFRPRGDAGSAVTKNVVTWIREWECDWPVRRVIVMTPWAPSDDKAGTAKNIVVKEKKIEKLILSGLERPTGRVSGPINLTSDDSRSIASGMQAVACECEYYLSGDGEKLTWIQADGKGTRGSTANPSYGNGDIIPTRLVGPEGFVDDEDSLRNERVTVGRIQAAAEALLVVAKETNCEANEFTSSGLKPLTAEPEAILFPGKWSGKELAWSYLDPEEDIRRQALAVELTTSQGNRAIVIEAELDSDRLVAQPERKESATLLIVRLNQQEKADSEKIKSLLIHLSRKRGVWGSVDGFEATQNIRHSNKRKDADVLASKIIDGLKLMGLLEQG